MSTDNATISFDNSTDAAFRAWGLRIAQAFATCGLVQTADTGQINWTTVTRDTGISGTESIRGYEMYRFNDTLQATKPIFVKFEYGHINNYNNYYNYFANTLPVIYITVGTATNGAGTLTGALTSTRTRFLGGTPWGINSSNGSNPSTAPSTSSPMLAAGSAAESYLNMAIGATSLAQPNYNAFYSSQGSCFPAMLCIERTRNADGTANGDGVIMWTCKWPPPINGFGTSPEPKFQIISFTGGGYTVAPQDNYIPFAYPGQTFGTASLSGDNYFFPLPVNTPKAQAQSLAFLGTFKNDVPPLATQTVTVLGTARTYVALTGLSGQTANTNDHSYTWGGVPNGAVLMRFE